MCFIFIRLTRQKEALRYGRSLVQRGLSCTRQSSWPITRLSSGSFLPNISVIDLHLFRKKQWGWDQAIGRSQNASWLMVSRVETKETWLGTDRDINGLGHWFAQNYHMSKCERAHLFGLTHVQMKTRKNGISRWRSVGKLEKLLWGVRLWIAPERLWRHFCTMYIQLQLPGTSQLIYNDPDGTSPQLVDLYFPATEKEWLE